MINEKMTISPIETTRSELIDYIEYPCFMNWRRLARKPAANGGICGKCPFRNYLEQFVIDNPTASPKFIKFLKEVSAQPELYQRITKLPGYKKQ